MVHFFKGPLKETQLQYVLKIELDKRKENGNINWNVQGLKLVVKGEQIVSGLQIKFKSYMKICYGFYIYTRVTPAIH